MTAALIRPASRKNKMKMPGVSLIAAAMPTPMPASRPWATRQMSVRMRASRIRLIWPRNRVSYTGSSAVAAAARPATLPAVERLDDWLVSLDLLAVLGCDGGASFARLRVGRRDYRLGWAGRLHPFRRRNTTPPH